MRFLSHDAIFTYRGNVLPLQLLGGEEYGQEKIAWSSDNKEIVQITCFSTYPRGGEFTDGVLLTFLQVGEATITAKLGRKSYTCKIEVREMRHTESSKDLQYFVGDMHDHTSNFHKLDAFAAREEEEYPANRYMKQMRADGKMDFAVVSDHASCLNARDYFRGFADADKYDESVVFFPGSEGQVTIRENDRYGIEHMHGGEILTFNAVVAVNANSWESFFDKLKSSPFAFCGYPHPQIIGSSVKGVWDFRHRENNSPRFKNLFRFVEMGDGTGLYSNSVNEYIYSATLDEGFHVSPTCASDRHSRWGYDLFPGKTVIMAPEKSKEAFHDAILSNRMYATCSGNVKLFYSVNGKAAPATLENEGEYRFHVECSYFRMGEPDTHIKKCKVITDKGITLVELENMGDVFDFTVTSPDSHYFYLCLLDEVGRKTWSCPVWTGKPFEKKKKENPLSPIAKEGITVFDWVSEQEIPTLINDDPLTPWHSEFSVADLIFDVGEETEVSALSHTPYWVDHSMMAKKWTEDHLYMQKFPSKYRISVSCNKEDFKRVAMGHFRIFGAEETARFEKQKSRYVRLEVLSTTGKEWEQKESAGSTLSIGEITLWN